MSQVASPAAMQQIDNERRLVVIQRNPTSGSGRGRHDLAILIRTLRNLDLQVRLFASRERLDEYVRDPNISSRVRCLVAAGGDGTIGSLVNRHSDFPVATLPMGTENLVARYLRIGRSGQKLARIIHRGFIRQFDTGDINGQSFLLMASVGLDADVVRRMDAVRTGNINHLSYLKPVIQSLRGYSYPQLSVYDGTGQLMGEGAHVIATNIPQYGFGLPFAPDASPFDGQLDVRIFRKRGAAATAWHILRTRLHFADHPDDVTRFQATEIRIEAALPDTPSQCDGDPAPFCPAVIRLVPSSMILVVPETT